MDKRRTLGYSGKSLISYCLLYKASTLKNLAAVMMFPGAFGGPHNRQKRHPCAKQDSASGAFGNQQFARDEVDRDGERERGREREREKAVPLPQFET